MLLFAWGSASLEVDDGAQEQSAVLSHIQCKTASFCTEQSAVPYLCFCQWIMLMLTINKVRC